MAKPCALDWGEEKKPEMISPVRVDNINSFVGSGPSIRDGAGERKWHAVFTFPKNEKSAMRQLELREIEAFLPTYETTKTWKNRQRVKTVVPLFPTYLFVNIGKKER